MGVARAFCVTLCRHKQTLISLVCLLGIHHSPSHAEVCVCQECGALCISVALYTVLIHGKQDSSSGSVGVPGVSASAPFCAQAFASTEDFQIVNATIHAVPVFMYYKFLLRTQDLKTKKHHIPVVDRTPLEPPPVVVVVVGPPKVGKSTVIKCLIKNFTRQKLVEIRGPVTIVSGENKDRRNGNASFVLLACLALRAGMCSCSHHFWSF